MDTQDIDAPVSGKLARIGLGARALVYLAISYLLLFAAFTGKEDDGVTPGEAFQTVEKGTGGSILLMALGTGLLLYAVWRYQQAGLDTDNQGNDAKGILARLGMASSGTSYALVGVAALATSLDADDSGGGGKTEESARWLMQQPFGSWLVGLAGLALIGIGIAQVWRTKSGQWKEHIDLSGWARRAVPLIQFGIAGRGVLFGIVGGFLVFAATNTDASDVKGLSATLGWLREQPFGLWLFIASAVAIGTYGLYSGVQSLRYRFPET
jgi:hypothetical protein